MPLSAQQTVNVKAVLARAADEYVRAPLWDFHPYYRPHVLHERAKRFGVPSPDDFDPEYH
jgi:hypothetical protein